MTKLLWPFLLIMVLLPGCGWNGTPSRNNDFTPLTSIQIVAVPSTIAAHTSTKLTVIGNFSGLYTRDITSQAVWSSASPTIADFVTASSPSRVTGLTPGTSVLTASVGSISNTFTLTVSSATIVSIAITPATPSVPLGLTQQFTAQGTFSDSTTQDITFDATWASSDTTVATVGNDVSNKGLAQTLKIGPTTISATFESVPGSTVLTVTTPVLQKITVSPSNPSLLSLLSTNFTATGTYSDGTTADITSKVTWSSSRTDIATISSTGAATTLLAGTSTITATLNGISGTTTLTVTGGNLTGITISPATSTMASNTIARITATGSFSNGVTRDITGMVTWAVNNTSVANVTVVSGNLAWLSATSSTPASTTITATPKTGGSVTGTTTVAVTTPTLSSLSASPLSLNLITGTSGRIAVTASFSDSTIQDVTYSAAWTSNNTAIATVGDSGLAKGRVTGVAAGPPTTTITATYGGKTITTLPTITVRSQTLQSLAISGSTTITSGNQVAFTATATYSDGTTMDVTEDPSTTWSISNTSVASLADSQNQKGQVVGISTGSTTLTANFGGKTQPVTITVQ